MDMIQKARAIAVSHGGECLVDEWQNVSTKIMWRCSVGHEWKTTYEKVAYQKSWCRQCATAARSQTLRERAYDTMMISAQKHNFICITPKEGYINVLQKIEWKCLGCTHHFATSWKALSTTSKFRCDGCPATISATEAQAQPAE